MLSKLVRREFFRKQEIEYRRRELLDAVTLSRKTHFKAAVFYRLTLAVTPVSCVLSPLFPQ